MSIRSVHQVIGCQLSYQPSRANRAGRTHCWEYCLPHRRDRIQLSSVLWTQRRPTTSAEKGLLSKGSISEYAYSGWTCVGLEVPHFCSFVSIALHNLEPMAPQTFLLILFIEYDMCHSDPGHPISLCVARTPYAIDHRWNLWCFDFPSFRDVQTGVRRTRIEARRLS